MAPNSTRLALRPLIGTTAWVPFSAHVARRGGNSRSRVQSRHSRRSPGCQPAFSRRIRPLFLRQMSRPRDIDVARALPARAGLVKPTPQGARADGEALGGQVV